MSDTKTDNPPAFPYVTDTHGIDHIGHRFRRPESAQVVYPGMTLRDYFAGQALVGLLAAQAGKPCEDCLSEDHAAAIAYHQADAMLTARKEHSDAQS